MVLAYVKTVSSWLPVDYPSGAIILQEKIYVDDILSGEHTIEAARIEQTKFNNILKVGGFPLRKGSSNEDKLISLLPDEVKARDSTSSINSQLLISVLGIT